MFYKHQAETHCFNMEGNYVYSDYKELGRRMSDRLQTQFLVVEIRIISFRVETLRRGLAHVKHGRAPRNDLDSLGIRMSISRYPDPTSRDRVRSGDLDLALSISRSTPLSRMCP